MEDYQQGGAVGRMGKKVQGIRSINDRYKIDRGRLRTVWEMEKPKNLYVRPMAMNYMGRGDVGRGRCAGQRGIKGGNGTTVIA